MWAHPADTSGDGRISGNELAAYAGLGPSKDLLQQAQNIFQLGVGGTYGSTSVGASMVHLPVNGGYQFVALERYRAEPLTMVEVKGLPSSSEGYVAFASYPSDLARYFPLSLLASGGKVSLVVPILPEALNRETKINVYLVEKGEGPTSTGRFDAGQISIAPMTHGGAGGVDDFLGDLDRMVEELERISGIDYSDFFGGGIKNIDSVSDPFDQFEIGLVCYLQDPQLEGGLRLSLASLRSSPELGGDFEVVLDEMFRRGGAEVRDVISQFTTQFVSDKSKKNRPRFKSTKSVTTANELLDAMLDAEVAKSMLESAIFTPEASAVNTAVGFAGAPGKIVSGSIGVTSAAMQIRYERMAFQNPSSATLKATFTKTQFYQDECWVLGQWSATADATSKEWRADAAFLEAALSGVGALDTAWDTAKVALALRQTGNAAEATKVFHEFESFGGLDVAKSAGEFRWAENLKKEYAANPGSNVVQFPKKTWTGIRFDDQTAQISANPASLSISGLTYSPTEVGEVTALVRVKDGLYGVGVSPSAPVTISLEQAEVQVSGCPANYLPGESYELEASLTNVAVPSAASFIWSADGGSLSSPVESGGRSTVTWTAPDPAPTSPVTITARSQADLCIPAKYSRAGGIMCDSRWSRFCGRVVASERLL